MNSNNNLQKIFVLIGNLGDMVGYLEILQLLQINQDPQVNSSASQIVL